MKGGSSSGSSGGAQLLQRGMLQRRAFQIPTFHPINEQDLGKLLRAGHCVCNVFSIRVVVGRLA